MQSSTNRPFIICCILIFLQYPINAQFAPINPDNITIARDEWGTPHIFAKTDPEVAYGLAWANAEDAFETVQEAMITAKGLMGIHQGKAGAPFDFFVQAIGAESTYQAWKDSIPADYLAYLDGYCQGVNAFAAAFPGRVILKKAFPIEPKDIIKTFLVSFAALSGSPEYLQNIMEGKTDAKKSPYALGSNAYAFSSAKTMDGKTYLCINPHFMVGGPFSFYDAHICSEEGLNMLGSLFQGGTSVFMGNNEHLGWGHTFNHLDQVDLFELKMRGKQYEFDGQYIKLEKRPIYLKVRIGKKLIIKVKRMTYWSKFGPTFKSPKKRYFALRSPSFWAVRAGEQFYRMNKATNFEEFKGALHINALPMFNIVYADKEDNLYYVCNGMIPIRSDSFDYSGLVTGNQSESLWTEYYPLEGKPHVENPDCGYVFNMNNTPTNASCAEANFSGEAVLKYSNLRSGDNNRSTRFMELIDSEPQMGWEEFKKIKFDRQMSKDTKFFESLSPLFQIKPESYPHIAEPIRLVQAWDGDCSLESSTATIVLITLQYIFKQKNYDDKVFISGVDISEAEYIAGIEYAARYLNKHFNSIRVPLSKVTCHERNGKLYCAAGFPDTMSPGYSSPDENGRLKMEYADTYIHFVRFGKSGPESIETLIPFEDTHTCEEYKDELEMFNKSELKPMSMDKETVLKAAKKVYAPKKAE